MKIETLINEVTFAVIGFVWGSGKLMSWFDQAFNACKKGASNVMNGIGYVADKVCTGAKTIVRKVKCKLGFHDALPYKKIGYLGVDKATYCIRCQKVLTKPLK